MAGTFTRPPTGEILLEQKRSIRRMVSKMFDRRRWKGPKGFVHEVGILLVIEIGTEGLHEGLVHIHVLVVGPEPEVARAAIEWMRDLWLELNPDANPQAQDLSACDGPEGFDKWLSYILKGCALNLAWSDDRLEAMVQALTDGSHRLTSYGLLRTRREKPRRKVRTPARPNDPTSTPNGFGHESVDTCCPKVSTLPEEKSSTVDNISRVSSTAFGLDQSSAHRDPEPRMMIHPRQGEHGKTVIITHPHTPTPLTAWSESTTVATVVPDGVMPLMVNGVAVDPLGLPQPDCADWEQRAQAMDFEEPPFDADGKAPAAGAVVVEPDGRLWLVSPTNGFGHYKTTFPKGKCDGMSLKATALKEVFEEAGLEIELFDHLIDVTKSTSRARYYLARRMGGNPADMCWEVQSVHLAPLEKAKGILNQKVDHLVIDRLQELRHEWAGWFSGLGRTPLRSKINPGETAASRNDEVDFERVDAEFERLFGPLDDSSSGTGTVKGAGIPVKKASGKMGRPITIPGPIGTLAQKVGGVGPLAQELGVSVRTIRRWATESVISKMGLKMLNHLYKRHAIDPEGLTNAPAEE
jgi:8-oxo-dGTP pyrophosphatase MutT (NUDIX family)